MKKLIFALAFVLGMSSTVFAQQPKVIVLLTKASWCSICKSNGPRFEKDIMPMVMKNKEVKMVMNDLSNDDSKAMSKKMLEEAGVYDFAAKNQATGMLYFFDAQSKKLLSKVSLAKSNDKIKEAYQKAMKKG